MLLRLLDAADAGAPTIEIRNVLFAAQTDDFAYKAIENGKRRAKEYRDGAYIDLLYLPPDFNHVRRRKKGTKSRP